MRRTRHGQAHLRGALPGAARVISRTGDPSTFALTFDDGPDPSGTPHVLETLAAAGAQATFFVLVDSARAHPSLVAEVVAAGHDVGLHSDRHERLDREPIAALTRRLRQARDDLEDLVGRPVVLHRPPFGRLSLAGARAARRAGLGVVLWSHDPRDWEHADQLTERVTSCVVPRAIVLLHDGAGTYPGQGRATADALRVALRRSDGTALSTTLLVA